MPVIELPGNAGNVVSTGTQAEADQQKTFLEARHAFAMAYCRERGWPEDATKLTFDQIFEIRDQPGWKSPADTELSPDTFVHVTIP